MSILPNTSSDVVIVANSARYLTQSARRGGLKPTVVDGFGDADVRAWSERFQVSKGFSAGQLAKAALHFAGDDRVLVYGAGFEANPGALARLERHFTVLGNSAATLAMMADTAAWFDLLDRLGIVYPPLRFSRPDEPGWLAKSTASQGGLAVCMAASQGADKAGYYQRQIAGDVCSILFAADSRQAKVIGYSRLRSVNPDEGDFRYAGAIACDAPEKAVAETMVRAAQGLTEALGLRGVNGLDFVINGDQAWFLELNARPPASLELHEHRLLIGDLPVSGFAVHINACQGVLPELSETALKSGSRVLYSPVAHRVSRTGWPRWCADQPSFGSWIDAGAPLCTVFADGLSVGALERTLESCSALLFQQIAHPAQEAA